MTPDTRFLKEIFQNDKRLAARFYEKLKQLENVSKSSKVFQNSNVIGSSLLFIHDQTQIALRNVSNNSLLIG